MVLFSFCWSQLLNERKSVVIIRLQPSGSADPVLCGFLFSLKWFGNSVKSRFEARLNVTVSAGEMENPDVLPLRDRSSQQCQTTPGVSGMDLRAAGWWRTSISNLEQRMRSKVLERDQRSDPLSCPRSWESWAVPGGLRGEAEAGVENLKEKSTLCPLLLPGGAWGRGTKLWVPLAGAAVCPAAPPAALLELQLPTQPRRNSPLCSLTGGISLQLQAGNVGPWEVEKSQDTEGKLRAHLD